MTRAAIGVFLALAVAGAPALAQDNVGAVEKIQQAGFQVIGARQGQGSPMEVGGPVFMKSRVYTKDYGSIDIRFRDDTTLTVAPKSSIRINNFVFSGDKPRLVVHLGQGAMRFISGRLPSRSYRLRSAVVHVGVRGTDVWMRRAGRELMEIWVDDGAVVASPVNSNEQFRLDAPAYAQCDTVECRTGDAPPRPVSFPADPRGGGGTEGPGEGGDGGHGGGEGRE